jgi:hypothetical protein
MKNQILKIAKVKSEAEFYRKFPSEEAFMKAHGKEFKKAQRSAKVDKAQMGIAQMQNSPQMFTPQGNMSANYNWGIPQQQMNMGTPRIFPSAQNPAPSFNPFGGYQNLLDWSKSFNNPNAPTATQANAARNVVTPYSPDYKGPIDPNAIKAQVTKPAPKKGLPFDAVPVVGGIIKGIKGLADEKRARQSAEQKNKLTGVQAKAAASRDINPIKNVVDRPENYVFDTASFFPKYGGKQFGVNALTAEDGATIGGNPTEIQNTYAPDNTIYSDLGYTPLNDVDDVKQYYGGGKLTKAGFGSFVQSAQNVGTTGVGGDIMSAIGPYGGSIGNFMAGGDFESNAGADIGGAIGGIFGPVGSFVGSVAGGLLDKNPARIKEFNKGTQRNMGDIMGVQMGQQNRSQFGLGTAEHGGWVSHDWQPQVITHFGENSMKNLLREDETMDTLRTGGHIRQNNMYPQDKYALGGQLKTTWGGHAEPISDNPYDESETVMFRGNSHDTSDGNGHTGIGVKYGEGEHDSYTDYAEYGTEQADADVEVQGNEPAIEMMDPDTGEKNLVVAGGIKTSKEAALNAGNIKFAGKKYQTNIADIAKNDAKLNKKKDKLAKEIDEHDDNTPFGQLALLTKGLSLKGIDEQQLINSAQKTKLLDWQNTINEAADNLSELHGKKVDPNFLEKGKIKFEKESGQAKYGKAIEKAQNGTPIRGQRRMSGNDTEVYDDATKSWISDADYMAKYNPDGTPKSTSPQSTTKADIPELSEKDYKYLTDLYEKAKAAKKGPAVVKFQKEYHRIAPELAKQIILDNPEITAKGKDLGYKNMSSLRKEKSRDKILQTNEDKFFGDRTKQYFSKLKATPKTTTPQTTTLPDMTVTATRKKPTSSTTTGSTKTIFPYKRNQFMDVINQVLPYLRPSDAEALDPYQVMGELSVMGDQPEGVQARLIQPELDVPYNISYQDQLDEITAQSRAAERMARNNPAAAAAILGQAARMKSGVKAEEFRANQAQRMGVYDRNRAIVNQTKLQNLGIADQQYVRQEQAKANTKATKLAALQSMSSKYLQNELANRKLKTAENLYNYRFDPNFRAINMNPLAQFNYSGSGKTTGGGYGLPSNKRFTIDPVTGEIAGIRTLSKEEIDETGKYGKSVKKKINLNSSVVKALKNI